MHWTQGHINVVTITITVINLIRYSYGADDLVSLNGENDIVQDKEHMKEHLAGKAKLDWEHISSQELDFHFFKLHDLNSDKLLDGLELYHAIHHGMEHRYSGDRAVGTPAENQDRINRLSMRSVDHVMTSDDKNDDGYLSYAEYANSRKMSKKFLQRMSPVNETVV